MRPAARFIIQSGASVKPNISALPALWAFVSLAAVGVCHGQSADEPYFQGAELVAAGSLEEAREAFARAVELDPFDLASAAGLRLVTDALDGTSETDAAVHLFKALDYGNQDMWDQALAEADAAVALEPGYFRVYNGRGNIHTMQGQYEQAIADYSKAIELAPDEPEAWHNRGAVYSVQGDYARAIDDLDKSLEADPTYIVSYFVRGSAYANSGDHERGLADFDKALEIHPRYAEVYLNRALLHAFARNDPGRAIGDLTRAIEVEPAYGAAYYNRGVLYMQSDEYDLAIADYGIGDCLCPERRLSACPCGLRQGSGDRSGTVPRPPQQSHLL